MAKLVTDGDAAVRRRAVETMATLRVRENTPAVIAMAKSDPDARVRAAACHTLGVLGEASARATLEELSRTDPDGFVKDMAQIVLRRL